MAHKPFSREVPGSTYAVLFIHGIMGTPDHFRELADLLPEDVSCEALLLPGHGGTVKDFCRSSMGAWRDYAAQRAAYLLRKHEKLLIVGHSMGCLFAVREAIRTPERIPQILLLNPPFSVCVQPRANKNTWQYLRGKDTPAARMLAKAGSLAPDKQLWHYLGTFPRYAELLAEIGRTNKRLRTLTVPTTAVFSREDELVSLRSRKYAERIPGCRIVVLENSGHYGYTPEDTQTLRTVFAELLDRTMK